MMVVVVLPEPEELFVTTVAETPPNVTPVAFATSAPVAVIVTVVPPPAGPVLGEMLLMEQGLATPVQTPASAGTAMLVITGTRATAILSARRREMGSSNWDTPRSSSPFCASSSSATRTTSSSSGVPVASCRILVMSVIVRLPSASFQTIAAV